MCDGIERLNDVVLHMAPGMCSWCMLVEFAVLREGLDDRGCLEAVITHPRYRDHCAGAFADQGRHDLHGPYRIDAISVDRFVSSTPTDALQVLEWWPATNLYPQHADALLLSREIVAAWVAPILVHANGIYRLAVQRQGNEHDWGWVVGTHGFHEYVAIDRTAKRVTLIIASDD
jgi:hypothetical protein